MVKATFAALGNAASPRSVANRRGKKVADLLGPRKDGTAEPAQEAAANV
jgi:small subunit ribosomal protein S5